MALKLIHPWQGLALFKDISAPQFVIDSELACSGENPHSNLNLRLW